MNVSLVMVIWRFLSMNGNDYFDWHFVLIKTHIFCDEKIKQENTNETSMILNLIKNKIIPNTWQTTKIN